MRPPYNTGLDRNQISLEVSVGTPGAAHTVANQFRAGAQRIKLAESSTNSGNIALTAIGSAQLLRSSYLVVQTIIDFDTLDPNQWEQLSPNLAIEYHLSGGFSGDQYFKPDLDEVTISQSERLVVVTKPFELA